MKEEPDSLSVPYNFARCFNAHKPPNACAT